VLLIAIWATLFTPVVHAQLPRRLDRCLSHPTLAEEFEAATNPTLSYPKVRIDAVTFEGADYLPESIKAQITRRLEEPVYDHDDGWIDASREIVLDTLREHGYFFAQVSAKTGVLSGHQKEQRVAVTFQLSEDRQYRLSEITFANAHVFRPAELRKRIPLQDGDVFNLKAIRKGLEALTRLYGTRGYLNFAPSPDLRADNRNQRISVLLDLSEGQQFKVGSVEVLGLDRQLWGPTLRSKLVPGQVFNSQWVSEVYDESKSVLPPDASPQDDVEITQDPKKATVAIVFNFLPCP
jgi:outer membrane protein assembly factor BamA